MFGITSCGKTELPNFEILGIDNSIKYEYEYTSHAYSLSTTTILTDTTIIWSTTGQISNYISIDLNRLTISSGLMPGVYSFKIHAHASKPNYKDKTIIKDITLQITDHQFSNFSIGIDGWTTLTYGYDTREFNLHTNNLYPTPDSITYSLSSSSTDKIQIDGAKLRIVNGLNPGTYNFQLTATVIKQYYDSKSAVLNTSLVVNNGDLPPFDIDGIQSQEMLYAGAGHTYTLSTTELPPNAVIQWSLYGQHNEKINIPNGSNTVIISNEIEVGIYKFTIQALEEKSYYNNNIQKLDVTLNVHYGVNVAGGDTLLTGAYETSSIENNAWSFAVDGEVDQSVVCEIDMTDGITKPNWLNFDSSTNKIYWSSPSEEGEFHFQVKATSVADSTLYGFSDLITLTITDGSVGITLSGGDTTMTGYSNMDGNENNQWSTIITGTTNQGVIWSFVKLGTIDLPTWLYFDSIDRKVHWTNSAKNSSYLFKIRATSLADPSKFAESATIGLTITTVGISVTGGDDDIHIVDFGYKEEEHPWNVSVSGTSNQDYEAKLISDDPDWPTPSWIEYDRPKNKICWNWESQVPPSVFPHDYHLVFSSVANPNVTCSIYICIWF